MKIIECPRDAMQGIHEFIPTNKKVEYINQLLNVGFDTIDFGSFVSPKAIPQMRDTADVLGKLNLVNTTSKLLAIVANKRGAEDACQFEEINYLGYPFSISETFQKRNTNAGIETSLVRVEEMVSLAKKYNKELVVYISMAFGNPYEEPWHPDIAAKWCEKLYSDLGVEILALSDTIGVSNRENISYLFNTLILEFPEVEFGAHLHTTPDTWEEKVDAAYVSGCRRFDGAIKGFGGCPMAKDDLTGNMPTENVIRYLNDHNIDHKLNQNEFEKCILKASATFPL